MHEPQQQTVKLQARCCSACHVVSEEGAPLAVQKPSMNSVRATHRGTTHRWLPRAEPAVVVEMVVYRQVAVLAAGSVEPVG